MSSASYHLSPSGSGRNAARVGDTTGPPEPQPILGPVSTTLDRHSYPFTAIVGQDSMKLALILNAIVPAIGGVLIRGEKGTGKSTAVPALARLLPQHQVVQGCHYGCGPAHVDNPCPAF